LPLRQGSYKRQVPELTCDPDKFGLKKIDNVSPGFAPHRDATGAQCDGVSFLFLFSVGMSLVVARASQGRERLFVPNLTAADLPLSYFYFPSTAVEVHDRASRKIGVVKSSPSSPCCVWGARAPADVPRQRLLGVVRRRRPASSAKCGENGAQTHHRHPLDSGAFFCGRPCHVGVFGAVKSHLCCGGLCSVTVLLVQQPCRRCRQRLGLKNGRIPRETKCAPCSQVSAQSSIVTVLLLLLLLTGLSTPTKTTCCCRRPFHPTASWWAASTTRS